MWPFYLLTLDYKRSQEFDDYVPAINEKWDTLRWYVWARHICDVVWQMIDRGESDEYIRDYLDFCMGLRERYASEADLELFGERSYTIGQLHDYCDQFGVKDPIYEGDLDL